MFSACPFDFVHWHSMAWGCFGCGFGFSFGLRFGGGLEVGLAVVARASVLTEPLEDPGVSRSPPEEKGQGCQDHRTNHLGPQRRHQLHPCWKMKMRNCQTKTKEHSDGDPSLDVSRAGGGWGLFHVVDLFHLALEQQLLDVGKSVLYD